MRTFIVAVMTALLFTTALNAEVRAEGMKKTLTVTQDAVNGTVSVVDLGKKGDSQGDMTVWSEPLLDETGKKIGTSNGFCVHTLPGRFSECRYTFTLSDGSISLAGKQAEKDTSHVAVVGGTGAYAGVTGEDTVTHNDDGTFTDRLVLKR